MSLFIVVFWIIIGSLFAFLFLKLQLWSVMVIHPSKPRASKWLIVGGAVIRWLLISILFIVAGFYSLYALFLTFSSFIISRLIILSKWQKSFNTYQEHVR